MSKIKMLTHSILVRTAAWFTGGWLLLYLHTVEREGAVSALLCLLTRALIPSWGLHPHHPNTFQRPRLLKTSLWGWDLHLWIWEGHKQPLTTVNISGLRWSIRWDLCSLRLNSEVYFCLATKRIIDSKSKINQYDHNDTVCVCTSPVNPEKKKHTWEGVLVANWAQILKNRA